MQRENKISVEIFLHDKRSEWQAFLSNSNNGLLYHDLDFLDYHPQSRFTTHHLMFYDQGKLVALFPAACVKNHLNQTILQSPYGASVGGFVLKKHLRTGCVVALVEALCVYVRNKGFSGINISIPPDIFSDQPNQQLSFAFSKCGFQLCKRSLTFVIQLVHRTLGDIDKSINKTKRYEIRTNLKKGVNPVEVEPLNKIDLFYDMLTKTLARRGSKPTHTLLELKKLCALKPGRVRLFMCDYSGVEVAAVLVFMLNEHVAYTFYFCELESYKKLCGPAILVDYIIRTLKHEGVKYLDLGPSISTDHNNKGVVFFKEGLGAVGFCRDNWKIFFD